MSIYSFGQTRKVSRVTALRTEGLQLDASVRTWARFWTAWIAAAAAGLLLAYYGGQYFMDWIIDTTGEPLVAIVNTSAAICLIMLGTVVAEIWLAELLISRWGYNTPHKTFALMRLRQWRTRCGIIAGILAGITVGFNIAAFS